MNTPLPQKVAHADHLPSIGTAAETEREDFLGPACSIGQSGFYGIRLSLLPSHTPADL
jgi:hypothetical protein